MLSDIVSIQKERFRRSSQQNEGNLHYKQKEKSNIPDVKLQQLESYHGSVNPAQNNMTLVELFKGSLTFYHPCILFFWWFLLTAPISIWQGIYKINYNWQAIVTITKQADCFVNYKMSLKYTEIVWTDWRNHNYRNAKR